MVYNSIFLSEFYTAKASYKVLVYTKKKNIVFKRHILTSIDCQV